MNSLLSNKYVWLFLIVLGLQIPLSMIERQIEERVIQRDIAKTSVRNSWTGEQDILAALLVIPFQEKIQIKQQDQNNNPAKEDFKWVDRRLTITPEKLDLNAELTNQTLSKGLYQVPVYTADIKIQTEFDLLKYQQLLAKNKSDKQANIRFENKPFISVGIKDIRGIVGIPKVKLNERFLTVMPGSNLSFYASGFNAELSLIDLSRQDLPEQVGSGVNLAKNKLSLSNELTINGMEKLSFLAMGRENDISASSDWPHPVFDGAFLPASREIASEGYKANWKTGVFSTNINATLESCFLGDCNDLSASLFGIKHVQSVDIYLQSLRSIKYGLLVILVTFCIFVLYEIISSELKIHPVTYALTGAALVIFFLLLIALSEHISFVLSYWIACFACSGLIACYIAFQTDSWKQGSYIGGLLNGLYLILFFIIRSEDHALLSGSLLLFFLLTLIMYVTRKIDWYQVLYKS